MRVAYFILWLGGVVSFVVVAIAAYIAFVQLPIALDWWEGIVGAKPIMACNLLALIVVSVLWMFSKQDYGKHWAVVVLLGSIVWLCVLVGYTSP